MFIEVAYVASWPDVRDRARGRVRSLRETLASPRPGSRMDRTSENPDLADLPHGRAFGPPLGTALDTDLTLFVYELLDAHHDTACLAREQARDDVWEAHLDYLRALQRAGRALLARSSVSPAVLPGRDA